MAYFWLYIQFNFQSYLRHDPQDCAFISKDVVDRVVFQGVNQLGSPGTPRAFHEAGICTWRISSYCGASCRVTNGWSMFPSLSLQQSLCFFVASEKLNWCITPIGYKSSCCARSTVRKRPWGLWAQQFARGIQLDVSKIRCFVHTPTPLWVPQSRQQSGRIFGSPIWPTHQ